MGLHGTEHDTILRGGRNRRESSCAWNFGAGPCTLPAELEEKWSHCGLNSDGSMGNYFSLNIFDKGIIVNLKCDYVEK